jgi:hypothetical protein
MTHFTESTHEETALEWLGCHQQRIACGSSDACTAHRRKCERILTLVGEVRVKDVEKNL